MDKYKDAWPHARVRANLNILSLYRTRVLYNICRNLEWQVCAALGKLPGSAGAEHHLQQGAEQPGPLNHLSYSASAEAGESRARRATAYAPATPPTTSTSSRFASSTKICSNGEELFRLRQGETWHCQLGCSGLRSCSRCSWQTPRAAATAPPLAGSCARRGATAQGGTAATMTTAADAPRREMCTS